ncbi:uncharacterized protein ACHE_11032S [Neofusicoccum parvum]|uniref:Uncharacterized protein ACHE_11032S n=1 Tax=Neofusicoccum parvum TaxID=310453 RepID=A0ACB5SRQ0_9PEZI|nr:uncharacterized protein ACHE_11032S [Neofusicoccum parvum]
MGAASTSTTSTAKPPPHPGQRGPSPPPLPPRSLLDQYWQATGLYGLVVRTALRTLQFGLAVAVAGLYGADLARNTATRTRAPVDWVYACVVAALSAITCAVHCFVTVKRVAWCVWDFVLAVLWAAAFGVFARGYLAGRGDGEVVEATDLGRMRAAVGIDCACMVLWFFTAVMGCAWCCRARRVTRKTDKLVESENGEGDVEMGNMERGSR